MHLFFPGLSVVFLSLACIQGLARELPSIRRFSFAPEKKQFRLQAPYGSIVQRQTFAGRQAAWLKIDTTGEHGDWNEAAFSNPATAPFQAGGCYRIDFEYRVLEQGEFYCLLRSFGKTRSDLGFTRWIYPSGWHGRQKIFVRLGNRPNYHIILGIKGPGTIEIGPVTVSRWDDRPDAAARTANLPDVTRKQLAAELASFRDRLDKIPAPEPENAAARQEWDRLRRQGEQLEKRCRPVEDWSDAAALLQQQIRHEQMAAAILQAWSRAAAASKQAPGFGLGIESALRKVFRDCPFEGCLSGPDTPAEAHLRAVRGEWEAFQVVVIPFFRNLNNLHLEVADLHAAAGDATIAAANIRWYRVGYVKTERAIYPTEHVGWWPDPLLPAAAAANVPAGEQQPFWIEVRVPRAAAPGEYRGRLRVLADGLPPREVTVMLRVEATVLPPRSSLRSCVGTSFGHPVSEAVLEHRLSPREVDAPVMYRRADNTLRFDFAPFDRSVDERLRAGATDFRVCGNMYWGKRVSLRLQDEKTGNDIREIIEYPSALYRSRLHDIFAAWGRHLEKRGLMDRAFVYPFDEPGPDKWAYIQELTRSIHQAAPGLRIVIPGIPNRRSGDRFPDLTIACPQTPAFSSEIAADYRRNGRELWWYVCCSPKHPYPNLLIDYPAMDPRILFWMTWKYRVKGFLYWQTAFWRRVNPWESPLSYPSAYGDGVWFYPAGGKRHIHKTEAPVPSIRLKIIRDGVEDYDLLHLLDQRLDRHGKRIDPALERQARALLAVPDTLIRGLNDYSREPARLLRLRTELLDLLEQTRPVPPGQ